MLIMFQNHRMTLGTQIKQESLEIVYSYWDGTGNRKSLTVKKGDRIDQVILLCLPVIHEDQPFWRSAVPRGCPTSTVQGVSSS